MDQKSRKTAVAVKAIIKNSKGQVLLLKRAKADEAFGNLWETPGGRLEIGEAPRVGLARELKEEVGIDVKVGRPVGVWDFASRDGVHVVGITFEATFAPKQRIALSLEHQDHAWVSATNLPRYKMAASLRRELEDYFSRPVGQTLEHA